MKHNRFRTDHLPFGTLTFDASYQRALIPARVRALISRWKLEDVGAITVSMREDGKPYVVDGQHRVRAANELGLMDTKVLCHIYSGLTIEEEARKFLALNDARSVTPIDGYRAGLVAQDPVCLGVHEILEKYDLRIASGNASGVVRCVSKALDLYRRDPVLLEDVVKVLTSAWGTRSAALENVVFTATGSVLNRYNGELDRGALVKKLAQYRGGPAALVGDARGLSDYKPVGVSRAAAEIIVDTYNRGRRSGQLSPL